MKIIRASVLLSLLALTSITKVSSFSIQRNSMPVSHLDCVVQYDSYRKFASIYNHYVTVNGKKYTIIDNGGNETKESIIKTLKANNCDLDLSFSYREGWASK